MKPARDSDRLPPRQLLLLAVLVGVMLAGFLGMVDRMGLMPLRDVRMMPSALVVPSFVVVGCCSVMASSVIVVFRSLAMMLGAFFGHEKPPMQYRKPGCRSDYATVNVE